MADSHACDPTRRRFTVETANRALPLVRTIVHDVVRQWKVVSELERRLAPHRVQPARSGPLDPYTEEIAHRCNELQVERNRLRDYLRELDELGIELKSVESGLCDFPGLRDGREVYLCWKLGEPAVRYWHELEAGVAGRLPVEDFDGSPVGPLAQ